MKKSTKINVLILVTMMVTSLTFCSPIITYAQSQAPADVEIENNEELIVDESAKEQNFSTAIEAIQYAQNKLSAATNITSTAKASIKVKANAIGLTIPAELESTTIVDASGRTYSVDACNAFESWLNSQYAMEAYSSPNSDKVYLRETQNVDTKTCVPTFTNELTTLSLKGAIESFGFVSNINMVLLNSGDIIRVNEFAATSEGYTIAVQVKESATTIVKQKLFKCAGLARVPKLSYLNMTFNIDKYGNMLSVQYSIKCVAQKRIDWNFVHEEVSATLFAEINQIFTNSGTNSFAIPSNVVL